MSAALMPLPTCPATPTHGEMELQQPGTPEQKWCGTWYRCRTCKSGVCFTSPELEAYLHTARAQATLFHSESKDI